jgi:hypothetical protein
MIDIREHGGIFGGRGDDGKYPNITVSLTPPSNPQKYDIWIKDTSYNKINFLFYTEPTGDDGDIKITKSNLKPNLKGTIDTKGKKITHTYVPNTIQPKIFDTKYFELFADLSTVYKKEGTNERTLAAYYFDGTSWVQFSFEETEIVGADGSKLYAYNYVFGTIRFSQDLGAPVHTMCIDKARKLIYVWVANTKTFYKLNFSFGILESYTFPLPTNADLAQVIESKKVAIFVAGNTIQFYDYTTGQKIKEYSTGLFRLYHVMYDEIYDRVIYSGYNNGSPGHCAAINYATNTLYKSVKTGTWGAGLAFSHDGQYVYFCYSTVAGSTMSIEKYRRNDLTLVSSYQFAGTTSPSPIIADDRGFLYFLNYEVSTVNKVRKYSVNDFSSFIWEQQITNGYENPSRNGTINVKPSAVNGIGEVFIDAINTGSGINRFTIVSGTGIRYVTASFLGLSTVGNFAFALDGFNF